MSDLVTDAAISHISLPDLFADLDLAVMELIEAHRGKQGHDSITLKSGLRALLTNTLHRGREAIRENLMAAQDGFACARALSDLMDKLVQTVYLVTTQALFSQHSALSSEQLAIIATGGYGRGKMAPGSDVDLLILLPYKKNAWTESVTEAMLYTLWDLKLKIGYATRTVDECLNEARADMTIRTSLLETRFLAGEWTLYNDLTRRFDDELVRLTAPEFIEAKLQEREARVTKAGAYRYLVEPNVKDGKGGLRDLNTLFWITRYVTRTHHDDDFIRAGLFTTREMALFHRCESFLWRVRCHLHFLAGRAQERLSFDIQPALAQAMGFRTRKGLSAVERFMKLYFLIAKDVGDLTAIVCAELEARHAKPKPVLERVWGQLKKRRLKTGFADFMIDSSGRLTVADADVFQRDPVNLIRLFWLADKINAAIQPDATRLATRSLKLMTRDVRHDEEANRLFMDILQSVNAAETTLRRMNEASVLGRFIPDFGKIVAMMQFNMYHHYTVDEHLLRCIGILAEIEAGRLEGEHPLANQIFTTIQNKRALYVALFLHDVAKGRPEDHSVAGADVARKLCPRLGLSAAETDTVVWLIEHHLLMSMVAQGRDLSDPKTIETFANTVQSLERLKLLLILTICDIKAVGPGVWNGWKGELLRTLYYETEIVLAGGYSGIDRNQRAQGAIRALREHLHHWGDDTFNTYAARHVSAYWLKTPLKRAALHAQMMRDMPLKALKPVTRIHIDRFRGVTEVDVLAVRHPNGLAILTGACAAAGANIVDASVFTTHDSLVLTTLALSQNFAEDRDEKRRAQKITDMISRLVIHPEQLASMAAQIQDRRLRPHQASSFSVVPDVTIDNALSHDYTVLEVSGLDRPGLLYDITSALARLNIDIRSAHIATFGERAVDVFYIVNELNQKITHIAQQERIRATLLPILDQV
jgi:[protein-PII] uridylyltransferase